MALIIRTLAPADGALLENVAADVFDDPIDPGAAEAFLAAPNHLLVAALDVDRGRIVVGFASGIVCLHPDKRQPELFVYEVGVAPAYQGQGVGKAIMARLLDESKTRGCRGAWVALDEDNEAALALYRAAGGRPPTRQLHIDFDTRGELC